MRWMSKPTVERGNRINPTYAPRLFQFFNLFSGCVPRALSQRPSQDGIWGRELEAGDLPPITRSPESSSHCGRSVVRHVKSEENEGREPERYGVKMSPSIMAQNQLSGVRVISPSPPRNHFSRDLIPGLPHNCILSFWCPHQP
jgi:hypothetical protein